MAQRFYTPISREFTNAGVIGAGFKLYFYTTGTSTPITTYSNVGLSSANTNPVIADAYGRFAEIFVSDFSLVKAILKDASDNTIWTVDPVTPSGAASTTLNDLGVRPTSYWGVTAGTSSAYTMVANPTITAYANNQTLISQAHLANAAAPTIAIDGLAAINRKKYTGQGTKVALQAGDLQATERYLEINDGTDLVVLNPRNTNIYTGTAPTLTIAIGAVTITNGGAAYTIDTEGAAATDDLDTINGGAQGEIIIIGAAASARDVVLKHNTGNLFNPGLLDVTLGTVYDRAIYTYNSTLALWILVSVSASGSTSMQLLQTKTASASASLEFTTAINSIFSKYVFEFINILPATDAVGFRSQISVDGGSTYVSSSYLGYTTGVTLATGSAAYTLGTGTIDLSGNFNADPNWGTLNSAAKGISGDLTLYNPSSATTNKIIKFDIVYTLTGAFGLGTSKGFVSCNNSTTAINAIRFLFSSGNIASGQIKMYGVV